MATTIAQNMVISSGLELSSGQRAFNIRIHGGGGSQIVYNGGIADVTRIDSGGLQDVFSGGVAVSTYISGGGRQRTFSGGLANHTTIYAGGYQLVSPEASAYDTKIYGLQSVGGLADNADIYNKGSQIVSGGSASNIRINSGGIQYMSRGAAANTIISAGGSQYVYSATVTSTTIRNGGKQSIASRGSSVNDTVENGGVQELYGSAVNTSLSGSQNIMSKGLSRTARVWKTGKQTINAGGVDSGAIVNGSQVINSGGKSYNAAINNGAFQIISAGGSANNTGLSGIQLVYEGAVVTNAKIYLKGEQRINSGANVVGAIATGKQTVYSGGMAEGGVFNRGASQNVYGRASGAVIAGTQILYSGGKAWAGKITGLQSVAAGGESISVNVLAGGRMNVAGRASNASVAGTQTILNGGAVTQTRIWTPGSQIVQNGGTETGTIVNGTQIISKGGRSLNAAINRGATQRIYGSANNTGLSGNQYVYAGATVTQAKIYLAGVQHLMNGASISGAKATGRQIVSAGATAANGVFNKGARQDVYGTATNITMAGVQNVYVGGTVNGGTVTATGWMNIDAGKLNLTANMSVAGQLTLANATVTGGAARQIQLTGTSLFTLGANNTTNVGITAAGKVLINNRNSKVYALTTTSAASTTFDLRNLSASASPLVTFNARAALNGYAIIQVKSGQGMGAYRLANNITRAGAVAIGVNGSSVGSVAIGGTLSRNGVKYTLTNAGNNLNLTLSLDAGRIYTATNARSLDSMTGTEKSDIFLNGQGNDVISGNGGRDVAVYGNEKWGKDNIQATNGTITLLFKDLKSSDVRQTMSGRDMILSKAGDSGEEIRVKDWNSATHNIVFGGTMGELSRYAAAASPSESLANAASNEVWRKSGLLA